MTDLLAATGDLAPLAVFLLAAGESAAFVGLFLPGELAIVLGGVLAARGEASLPAMLAASTVGAIVGDSVGYAMGRRLGTPLFARRPALRLRVERAAGFVDRPRVVGGGAGLVLSALVVLGAVAWWAERARRPRGTRASVAQPASPSGPASRSDQCRSTDRRSEHERR